MQTKCFCLILLCTAVWTLPAPAEEETKTNTYQPLLENSPFLTPAFKARLGKHDTVAMNFIGYTRIEGDWFFAILDRKSGAARWLKLGAEEDNIKVESFDEKERKIHLTVGGIGVDLVLEKETK